LFIMNNIDLSIITVAFKSQDQIPRWVDSIVKTVKKNSYEMIVSDNSPDHETEEVVEKLKAQHQNLVYVYNNANIGFSAGNNVGVKKSKGKYLLFLNPDMEVQEGTIDGFIEFLKKNPDAGTATPAVFLPSGKLDDSCHRGFPTPWNSFTYFSGLSKLFPKTKLFAGYNMTYLDFLKTHEIDSLAGSFLIISRKLGNELKWWDEDYFFYGEDIDFCYRIKRAGYKIFFVPVYKALHHKGMSSGIKKVSQESSKATLDTKIWATNQRFKAMEIFYRKHYQKKYPLIINQLVYLAIKMKRSSALKSLRS
jgi:GT2 family glycosyltransferase